MAIEISERIAPPGEQGCFKLLACSERRQILRLLAQQPGVLTLRGLEQQLDHRLQEPTVSYHLRKLREAGLIELARQDGHFRYYAPVWGRLAELRRPFTALLSVTRDSPLPAGFICHASTSVDPDLWCQVFALPLREPILRQLVERDAELTVEELVELLPFGQAWVSRQLLWFFEIGLVSRRKGWLNHFYRVHRPRLVELAEQFDAFLALERRHP
jgi:DNA-binding transcriptional ArsR family regulator